MAEIRELPTARLEQSKEVVAVLEEALEEARRGEITAIAIAAVTYAGGMRTVFSSSDNVGALLGAAARLAYRLSSEAVIIE